MFLLINKKYEADLFLVFIIDEIVKKVKNEMIQILFEDQ